MTPINNRLDSIQILRAIAAWLVVFHHYNQVFFNWDMSGTYIPYFISNFTHIYGKMGVDLFFIVSGLIMFITISKSPNAMYFLLKRVIRVYPPYWFYTALLLVIVISSTQPYFLFEKYTLVSVAKSLMLIPNENPNGIGLYPFLTVGWTLFFEMAFYVICTLGLMTTTRYWWIITIAILTVIPKFWSLEWGSYFFKSSYISEFAIGLSIGFILIKSNLKKNMLISFSMIALGIFNITPDTTNLLTQINLGLIVFGFAVMPELKNRFFDAAVNLGSASYSTYLIHVIVLVTIYNFLGANPSGWEFTLSLITYLTVTAILSLYSYKYIEVGFVNRKLQAAISNLIMNGSKSVENTKKLSADN
ncbi:acyltransferase [Aeromonas jandaei]|uniref:acyltransferase family protein n=1 Tax=Aeromonas jandaei TaxID=650 RepID=UPI001F1A8836|nr:acyltransferase [Aeromonas jandaei]MCF7718092.1 acyltransferase [Aeromonas jandaei]